MAKLSEKQKRFVQEYLVDLNATAAAKRAGYSAKTACEQGARLLANVKVQAEIQKAMEKRQTRTEITQDRVLQELASIAFSKGTDYASVIAGCVVVNDTDELTEQQKAAIVSIKQTKEGVEIKLADKYKALELLAKHLGLLTERPEAEDRLEDDPLTKSIKEAAADGFFKETTGDTGISDD
ncbi:terminase small subunit [Acutalibacter sp. 1XD8-36]|uniref:terminase small subunit n=1 Tax=Acutalibacter sp. 1XD8-36 TaxID=2320852 RepID=UPI002607E7A4|nr:terminase small subunit [Acutalibacter sp. 1XD8-36]